MATEMLTLRTHDGKPVRYPRPKGRATFNLSRGDGVSRARWTHNVITGCLHGCPYCYAREIATSDRFASRFRPGSPRLRPERLEAPQHTSIPAAHRDDPAWHRVFCGSMADNSVGVKCPVLAFLLVQNPCISRFVSATRVADTPSPPPVPQSHGVCRSAGPGGSRPEVSMSDVTKIEWTDHTFNPWWGCSRVSPACRFCYADRDARRYGHELWRRNGPRRMLSESELAAPT